MASRGGRRIENPATNGGTAVADLRPPPSIITRSRPHESSRSPQCSVALRKLRLDRTLAATRIALERERAIALIVARILAPGSKLATARGLAARPPQRDSLAEMLGDSRASTKTSSTPPWTGCSSAKAPSRSVWPNAHLSDGALVLYDLTSTYLEGRCCPLAKRGYSRDGRRDKLQIVFGLLCNRERVARSPSRCSTATPPTPTLSARKLRSHAPCASPSRAWCSARRPRDAHRGAASVRRSHRRGSIAISALRAPVYPLSVMSSGAVQRSMFDDTDLAEIRCDAYPGEQA